MTLNYFYFVHGKLESVKEGGGEEGREREGGQGRVRGEKKRERERGEGREREGERETDTERATQFDHPPAGMLSVIVSPESLIK